MVNNKGLIRIIEATIALVIIIGFLILAQVKIRDVDEASFSPRVQNVLEEIARNPDLRDSVYAVNLGLKGKAEVEMGALYDFVDSEIRESYLGFRILVCENIDQICSLDKFIEGDVFADERVLVPSVKEKGELNARKIALFVYRK